MIVRKKINVKKICAFILLCLSFLGLILMAHFRLNQDQLLYIGFLAGWGFAWIDG